MEDYTKTMVISPYWIYIIGFISFSFYYLYGKHTLFYTGKNYFKNKLLLHNNVNVLNATELYT